MNPIRTGVGTFTPCAQCGEELFAPEWSEHVNERCIRHLWTCDACGYQFETTVYLGLQKERRGTHAARE